MLFSVYIGEVLKIKIKCCIKKKNYDSNYTKVLFIWLFIIYSSKK